MKYPAFDETVKICLKAGVGCSMAKSDMSSAFRHVPMRKEDWALLVMNGWQDILFCGQTHAIWQFYKLCYFPEVL